MKWKPYIPAQLGKSSQGWYVYFSYWNPTTEKYERQPQIKKGLNRIKSLEERKKTALDMIRSLNELLEAGHLNPFKSYEETIHNTPPTDQLGTMPLITALEWAFKRKVETLAPGTIKQYEITKNFILDAIKKTNSNIPVKQVKKAHIKTILAHVKKSRKSTNSRHIQHLTFIQSMFAELEEWEVVDFSPARRIRLPKAEPPTRFMPLTEQEKIEVSAHLKREHFPMYVITKMVIKKMLRMDDVLSIMAGDIQGEQLHLNPRFQNSKHKKRTIYISADLQADFKKLPQPEPGEYYFSKQLKPGPKKVPSLVTAYYWRKLISGPTGIGINKMMYCLKYTGVNEFIRGGGTMDQVKLIAGHSVSSTSRHYDTMGAEEQMAYEQLRKTDPEY